MGWGGVGQGGVERDRTGRGGCLELDEVEWSGVMLDETGRGGRRGRMGWCRMGWGGVVWCGVVWRGAGMGTCSRVRDVKFRLSFASTIRVLPSTRVRSTSWPIRGGKRTCQARAMNSAW